ncbi:MAG: thiol-disulfide oxidoreductase DCC family protein, partial [Waterburya sp.]
MTTDLTNNLTNKSAWKIKLLYDGECPLCVKEVNFLTKKDAGREIIKFVDITELDYDPEDNANIDYATAMGRIHAILADGTVIKNVEVFRRIYEELGIGWVYAITKL